jgi:hypothetical protein
LIRSSKPDFSDFDWAVKSNFPIKIPKERAMMKVIKISIDSGINDLNI